MDVRGLDCGCLVLGLLKGFDSFHFPYICSFTPFLSGLPRAFAIRSLRLVDFGVDRNALLVPHKPISTSFLTSVQSFPVERTFMSFKPTSLPLLLRGEKGAEGGMSERPERRHQAAKAWKLQKGNRSASLTECRGE